MPLVGTFATRSDTLATAAGAAARGIYQRSGPAVEVAAATIDQRHCSHEAATFLCVVWNNSNGIVAADAEWEGSTNTPAPAHSRLGNSPGAACGLGTFVINSPAEVMAPGDLASAQMIEHINADWSDRFYDITFYSKFCALNA
jgi:hypothetical protein